MTDASLRKALTTKERIRKRIFTLSLYGSIAFLASCLIYIGYTYRVDEAFVAKFGLSEEYIDIKCSLSRGNWEKRQCSLFEVCDPKRNAHMENCSCTEEYYCKK